MRVPPRSTILCILPVNRRTLTNKPQLNTNSLLKMTVHLDHVPKVPGMHSWTHISEIPAECAKNEPCVLGVDEAGSEN